MTVPVFVPFFVDCAHGTAKKDPPKTPEQPGDARFAMHNSITDTDRASENINPGIENYEKAMTAQL
ncbi:MAG: hypothetical protein LLG37_04005 [Spirochaetia bacterium]|nr:hypothetical protein [Spirochaetia bacterium]